LTIHQGEVTFEHDVLPAIAVTAGVFGTMVAMIVLALRGRNPDMRDQIRIARHVLATQEDLLETAWQIACDLARSGQFAAGLRCLQTGQRRAKQAEREGIPMADQMVHRSEKAVEQYRSAFHMEGREHHFTEVQPADPPEARGTELTPAKQTPRQVRVRRRR
jgi:hypothetical protein